MRWLWVVAVFVLAGCSAPPVWTPEVRTDAPAEGGPGPRLVTLHGESGGATLPTAFIVFWTTHADGMQRNGPVELQLLGLRSNNGTVVAHVPSDRDLYIVVGAGDDWTEEWSGPYRASIMPLEQSVRLYTRAHGFAANGSWGPVAVGADLWPYADYVQWQPTLLNLSEDPDVNGALQRRIGMLEATLAWENTPTAGADLGLLFASGKEASGCNMQDDGREVAPGKYTQKFTFPYMTNCGGAFPEAVDSLPPPVYLGPGTSAQMVAPFGLPYNITGEVELVASHGWQELSRSLGERGVDKEWLDPALRPRTTPPAGAPAPRAASGAEATTASGPSSARNSPVGGMAFGLFVVLAAGASFRSGRP